MDKSLHQVFKYYLLFWTFLLLGCGIQIEPFAGSGEKGYMDGVAINARFNGITGLAVDNKGNLFIVDEGNKKIRKVTTEGFLSSFAGSSQGYADGKGTE